MAQAALHYLLVDCSNMVQLQTAIERSMDDFSGQGANRCLNEEQIADIFNGFLKLNKMFREMDRTYYNMKALQDAVIEINTSLMLDPETNRLGIVSAKTRQLFPFVEQVL